MGARLVTLALSPRWASLSDAARLVLVTMCHTAKDLPGNGQPDRQYFGGHDRIIHVLTGRDAGDDAYRASPAYRSDRRRAKRLVQELIEAGAIQLEAAAYRGRHAYYRVLPDEPLLAPGLPSTLTG